MQRPRQPEAAAHYAKVVRAIQYLSDHAIAGIVLLRYRCSDHCFGQSQQAARHDRINVRFQYYGQIVDSQIIFDSSDYTFPPDIAIAEALVPPDPALLPDAWHIDDTACLHDWLRDVRQKIFDIPPDVGAQQEESVGEQDELMEEYDEDQQQQRTAMAGSHDQAVKPQQEMDMDIEVPSTEARPASAPPEPVPKVTRRSFIEHWLQELPDHIIRYDADTYESIVLYLSVKIPPKIWKDMERHHQRSLRSLAGTKMRVSKAKDVAPCLVQFTLPEHFPNAIQVTLISAINVDPHHEDSYWPDRTVLVLDDIDPTSTVSEIETHIRQTLTKMIPRFHSGLYRDDGE